MRIAAIYWPTSSVGGINTELRAFKDEAERRGHTFHVFCSAPQKSKKPVLFSSRKLIRGGDTFITIDGELPHHPMNVNASAAYLNENYDLVYMAFLCPHPTKAYGDQPIFMELFKNILLPITARVTDGYWDSYSEWGTMCLRLCQSVTTSHRQVPAMIKHVKEALFVPPPFSPRKVTATPSKTLLTTWISQWKAIKGIHRLLPVIPEIPGTVELYGNGILYYQLRTTDDWKRAVKTDHFKGFNGAGKADFFGVVPLDDIPNILTRSWFMIDLMGMGNPKNKMYQQGTFNNTALEAMYYGCCPVLHRQASLIIPKDLAVFVDDASEVPNAIKVNASFGRDPKRAEKAKRWVKDTCFVDRAYDLAVLGEH